MFQAINHSSQKTIKDSFDNIARQVLLESVLKVANKEFRITEIEFYYYHELKHPDPFVHCDALQMEKNKFYFHGSGLDLTFGDNDAYSSLLIRGIWTKDEGYKNGPLHVVHEIFKTFTSISDPGNVIRLIDYVHPKGVNGPFKTTRIGLDKAKSAEYYDKPYRYISDVNKEHKFKNKESVVQKILADDAAGEYNLHDMLGYKLGQTL